MLSHLFLQRKHLVCIQPDRILVANSTGSSDVLLFPEDVVYRGQVLDYDKYRSLIESFLIGQIRDRGGFVIAVAFRMVFQQNGSLSSADSSEEEIIKNMARDFEKKVPYEGGDILTISRKNSQKLELLAISKSFVEPVVLFFQRKKISVAGIFPCQKVSELKPGATLSPELIKSIRTEIKSKTPYDFLEVLNELEEQRKAKNKQSEKIEVSQKQVILLIVSVTAFVASILYALNSVGVIKLF